MELSVGAGRAAKFIAASGALATRFVLVDIGARDGIHPRWAPFEPAMEVYGFDPIADIPAPNDRHRYLKLAIGATDGTCRFVVPDNLYEARISAEGTHHVPIARLDTLWDQQKLPPADFIKIDCEGHELEVLRGAPRYLQAGNLLGADVETSFHVTPAHEESHFVAINAPFVAERLLVAELAFGSARVGNQRWNGTCNVLLARHLIHEHSHPEHYTLRAPESQPSPDAILKLIAVFDVYDLAGAATGLLNKFSETLADRIDVPELRNRLIPPPRPPRLPSTALDRFLPHLGLGIWTGVKRRIFT